MPHSQQCNNYSRCWFGVIYAIIGRQYLFQIKSALRIICFHIMPLHQHADAFAIMMETYLSGTKLDIIKAYFPSSYKAFLGLIAKIKEQ